MALVPVQREEGDLTVFVRKDGQIFVEDELVGEGALTAVVRDALADDPDRIVVVAADGGVEYSLVQSVVELVRRAGPKTIGFESSGIARLGDDAPKFDGGEIVELTDVDKEDLQDLKPRRHRFPQDPYANVASFTANTLEFGEWKVGLTGVWVGVLPGIQVGTSPALDVAGGLNFWSKAQLVRTPIIDGALMLQYYRVPNWAFDLVEDATENVFEGTGGYLGLGAIASLKPAKPWSVHVTGYWARPWIKGDVEIDKLPGLLFPGLEVPETNATIQGKVAGDLVILSLASDLRFNRRDSAWVWGRFPLYGSARGQISAEDVDQSLENLDLIVAYGAALPFSESYSVAFGYMASWRNFEARIGVGFSGVQYLWALQAFDLSYRFGGPSRKSQREIRQGFRDQKRDFKALPVPAPGQPTPAPEAPTPPPQP